MWLAVKTCAEIGYANNHVSFLANPTQRPPRNGEALFRKQLLNVKRTNKWKSCLISTFPDAAGYSHGYATRNHAASHLTTRLRPPWRRWYIQEVSKRGITNFWSHVVSFYDHKSYLPMVSRFGRWSRINLIAYRLPTHCTYDESQRCTLSAASGLAPASSKWSTTSVCPRPEAHIRAVIPCWKENSHMSLNEIEA